MKIHQPNGCRAFTLFEGLVMAAALAFLLAVFLPILVKSGHRCALGYNCFNNLRQVGIGFRIWAGDHNDRYPMDVSVASGGAQELIAAGNVAACFQVMSNELADPGILVCPQDHWHRHAANFGCGFTRANLSYFIGLDATEENPTALLSGDANLIVSGKFVSGGILDLRMNPASWASNRHDGSGHVLLSDGSVEDEKQIPFMDLDATCGDTNLLVIP